MPELPDQQIDADIARTLKFNTLVRPNQQQNARERLLRSASEQTVLSPVSVVVAPAQSAVLRDYARVCRQQGMRLFRFLVVDSTCYERARRPPTFFQYYSAHGRGAFTIIHVSA